MTVQCRRTVWSRRSCSSISPRRDPPVRQADWGLYKHLSTAQVWRWRRNTMQKVSSKHLNATPATSEPLRVLHDLLTTCQAKVALLSRPSWGLTVISIHPRKAATSSELNFTDRGYSRVKLKHVFGRLGLVITVHVIRYLSGVRCSDMLHQTELLKWAKQTFNVTVLLKQFAQNLYFCPSPSCAVITILLCARDTLINDIFDCLSRRGISWTTSPTS